MAVKDLATAGATIEILLRWWKGMSERCTSDLFSMPKLLLNMPRHEDIPLWEVVSLDLSGIDVTAFSSYTTS